MARTNKDFCLQTIKKHVFTGHGTSAKKVSDLTGLDIEKVRKAVKKLEDEGRGIVFVPHNDLIIRFK